MCESSFQLPIDAASCTIPLKSQISPRPVSPKKVMDKLILDDLNDLNRPLEYAPSLSNDNMKISYGKNQI